MAAQTTIEIDLPPSAWEEISTRIDPDHRLLTGPWFDAWARHLLPRGGWQGPVRYAVARDAAEELLALIPLATQKVSIFRLQSLAGYYFPLRAFPVACEREDEAAEAFAGILAQSSAAIGFRFGPVERGDRFLAALVGRLRRTGWSLISRDVGAEFLVRLPATVAEFRGKLGRNLRTNIPYKERRMNREGRVRVAFLNGVSRLEWNEAISAMGEVETQSWIGSSGGHLHFGDERNARFWSEFLATPAASSAARAWVLHFNDRPASFYFSLDSGACRYFIAGLYTDAVARYSAGYMLMQRMLEDAIVQGIPVVNLGLGDAGYKSRWGAKPDRQLEDWVALPPGLLGKALAAVWRVRERLAMRRSRRGSGAPGGDRGESAED